MVRVADDAAMLQHAIVENIQREELNPLEEAARVSTAHRGFLADPRRGRDPRRQEPGDDHATRCGSCSSRRRSSGASRTARSAWVTPGRCWAPPTAPSRNSSPSQIVAEDLSVREVEEAIRGRQEAPAKSEAAAAAAEPGGRLRPPGLLELEELLGDYLETRVRITMGARHGRVSDRLREPRGPRAHLPRDEPGAGARGRRPAARSRAALSGGSSTPRRRPSTSARVISGSRAVSIARASASSARRARRPPPASASRAGTGTCGRPARRRRRRPSAATRSGARRGSARLRSGTSRLEK